MDTIFLMAVTGYLLYRLWMVFGQEADEDYERRGKKSKETNDHGEIISLASVSLKTENPTWGKETLIPRVQTGLKALQGIDSTFSVDSFMAGAKSAYEIILLAFTQGDKETLTHLLTRKVFAQFESAIDGARSKNLNTEIRIESFDKIDIDSIDVSETQTTIVVRFKTSQVRFTKESSGTIIDNPAQISTSVIDIWTFSRPLTAQEPTWFLAATRTETSSY